jgi:cytoskeletal protein RodZ
MKDPFGSPSSLRIAREQLSLSLDEVHELLNVNKEYLELLENSGVEELEKVIAPVYARGCHRIYTKYLRAALLNHLDNFYQAQPLDHSTKGSKLELSSYWKVVLTVLFSLVVSFGIKFS